MAARFSTAAINRMLDDGSRPLRTHDGTLIPCDQCGRKNGAYRPHYRTIRGLGRTLICEPCVAGIDKEQK